jgi:RNA polymerase sigma-70 factor (ECF subfamily)
LERLLDGDRSLIEALRQGQNAAWTELVNRYLKLVLHVVRRTLSMYRRGTNDEDAEDVAHEFFTYLCRDQYRALGMIGAPYDLKAWLAIGARRRAIDFVRKKRLASVSLEAGRSGDNMTLAEAAAPETKEPDLGGQQAAVAEALGTLSPKERLIVQLFYLKGLKYREIAKITGVNMNSISPTLARAVEKMQKVMKSE